MYIDDGSDGGELKVTVSGEEYTAESNYDYNGDGYDDSVVVDSDHGGELIYTDTDFDGVADALSTFDAGSHDPGETAHFDADRGEWVSEERAEQAGSHRDAGHGDSLSVPDADGGSHLEHATIDTDGDGVLDTASAQHNGSTFMYTDMDGDGAADRVTEIGANGDTEVRDLGAEHEWTVTDRAHLGTNTDRADDSAWAELFANGAEGSGNGADGVVRIDASTGQWISPN